MTLTVPSTSAASRLVRRVAGAALGLGLFAVAGGFAGLAQAQAVPAPSAAVLPAQGPGPALWVVRDADSTIYLFGTVHVLRPTTAWGSARVDRAFDSASDVWFEISNPDDQAAILPLIQQQGVSPDRPLSSLLDAEERAALDAAARTAGLSAAQMEPFRPWLAGLTLSVAPLVKAGYDPASGVELILKARAQAAGKSIHGFETLDQQVGLLAGLPEATQLEFLRTTLEDFETATSELDQLVAAWAAGDLATLTRLGVDEFRADSEDVYRVLLADRNADWAGQIQTLLAGSGVAFVAVGAAHLVGDDSVQAELRQRGIAVEAVAD